MALSPRIKKILRKIRNLFLILFVVQLVYIIALKWVDPPVTLTQLGSWFQGYGLKRDYVERADISKYAGLAVMASEDQLFPEHNGFDWKSIEKAMKNNQKTDSCYDQTNLGLNKMHQILNNLVENELLE